MCLVLLMIMLLSSTIAWFTDTKGNVNTMVAGKISIDQQAAGWQDLIMMPSQTYPNKVTVFNTGNQAAYLRTLFAFEDHNTVKVLEEVYTDNASIVIPGVTNSEPKIQFTVTKKVDNVDVITVFTVGYYIHPNKLMAKGVAGDSVDVLGSVTLAAAAGNEWTNAVGEHYELMILSQAVQCAGLSDKGANGEESPAAALNIAFDEITAQKCAQWFALILSSDVQINPVTNP